jgi:hypothetical protein
MIYCLEQKGIKDYLSYNSIRMNAILKVATITNLIAEIVVMDKDTTSLNVELDFLISHLTKYKKTCAECVVAESLITLTPAELALGLSEAYREGKKDGREETETELNNSEDEDEEEEDEEEELPDCKCNNRMDIRARCDPIRSAPMFAKCPARVDTAFFHICNTWEFEKKKEECGDRGQEHELLLTFAKQEPYCLEDEDDELIYLAEQEEENDSKYNCLCCGEFVSFAEECDEGRWECCDIVCGDCKVKHYCEDCDNFYQEEEDLTEYKKKMLCEDCLKEAKEEDDCE